MNQKLVTVARFTDYMKAELARQLLEGQGITAFVLGGNTANVYGGVPAAIDIELQTPESQADEAREILEANRPQEGSEQDWDEDAETEQGEDLEQE